MTTRTSLWLLPLLSLAACTTTTRTASSDGAPPATPDPSGEVPVGTCDDPVGPSEQPEAGVVKGRIVTACGAAIPALATTTVIVRNAFAGPTDSPTLVTPDPYGRYRQELG